MSNNRTLTNKSWYTFSDLGAVRLLFFTWWRFRSIPYMIAMSEISLPGNQARHYSQKSIHLISNIIHPPSSSAIHPFLFTSFVLATYHCSYDQKEGLPPCPWQLPRKGSAVQSAEIPPARSQTTETNIFPWYDNHQQAASNFLQRLSKNQFDPIHEHVYAVLRD